MNTEISAAWSKFLKIDSHSSPLLDELENFIAHCQSSYYNTALEVVNDSTYDKLEAILKEYRPKSKALRIRAPVTKKLKVRLPFPMSSLGKINLI